MGELKKLRRVMEQISLEQLLLVEKEADFRRCRAVDVEPGLITNILNFLSVIVLSPHPVYSTLVLES